MTFWQFVTNAWTGLADWVRNKPNHPLNICRAALGVAGLIYKESLTPELVIAIGGLAESVFQGINAKATVASVHVEQRKQEAFEKGVAAGVAQVTSGTGDGRG